MLQRGGDNADSLAVQVIQHGRKQQCDDNGCLGPEAEVRHCGFPRNQGTRLSGEIQGPNLTLRRRKESISRKPGGQNI
jgi:hypothetical protein